MDQHLPIVLNEENLPAWMARQGWLADTAGVRVRVMTGGVSNQAFWVEGPHGVCVVKQARPRLAVATEWRADVGRIVREAEAMQWLGERIGDPRIPHLLHLHREAKVLAMEAVLPPAENYKEILLRGEVDLAQASQFGALLAEIHSETADPETREAFGDATYFDQLRLAPYYGTVAERHPDVAGQMESLRAECLEERFCLVHGDYSPKNVLVRAGGLVLLDYEVAHWGNPCFDIGFALTHYLCKAIHMPGIGRAFAAAALMFWEVYRSRVDLPKKSRARAGTHLAGIMLARMDGKSPLEYFTGEGRRDRVRSIAKAALLERKTTVDSVIDAVMEHLP